MLGSGAVLGVLEDAMRAALASAGAALLQAVLDQQDDGYAGPRAGCVSCGGQAGHAGSRPKTITTVLGPVTLQRAWYHCAACRRGFAPRDRQLGLLPGGALSPGLAEMTALACAEVSFARAAALLAGLAGITLSPKTIERSAEASGATAREAAGQEAAAIRERRIVPLPPPEPVPDMLYVEVDGTGVPVRASETAGRAGKGEDGKAGTREVKLAGSSPSPGWTPTASRSWTRAPPPTSSASTARTPSPGSWRPSTCAAAATTTGRSSPSATAPPGSGPWPGPSTRTPPTSPTSTTPASHLHDLAAHLAFITPDPAQWLEDRSAELDAGEVEALIAASRCYPLTGVKADDLDKKLGYFERNTHRMRYADFSKLGMFIGSGAIEGGIKAVVVQRAKQSGMHWSVDGAADIIALRSQQAGGRWDAFVAPATPSPSALCTAV